VADVVSVKYPHRRTALRGYMVGDQVPRGEREAPVYEFEISRIHENDVISERYNEYYVNTFRHQMCKKLRSMSRYGFVPDKFDGYSMSCGIVRAKILLVDWV
jgi:hypothetical protein